MKKLIVFSLLGPVLDRANPAKRWSKWRPSVAVCQQEDLLIHRLELLYQPEFSALAESLRRDIAEVAPETEARLHEFVLSDPWDFESVYAALHDFTLDYPFDPEGEEYLVHITTGTHVAQICLFLLTEARYFPARLLQTSPGQGEQRAIGSYGIIDLDLSRYDRIAQRFQSEQRQGLSFLKAGIETRNTEFNRLMERIEQVAIRSRAPLLLSGPTGAGKTQLARRIYELKKSRRQLAGPFVEINCATLRGDNAMASLFGHTRGAFTGALRERSGLLCRADGGLLFLDEIGELGLDEQAMLLRAVEDKRFLPLGSDRETGSDFQLIAGSNRDLAAAVRAGTFREDLLARINLWSFELPGLAQRREDIEPNLDYELDRFARENGVRISFNKEARTAYLDFAVSPNAQWRANFRDLGASITRLGILAAGARIDTTLVAEEIRRLQQSWRTRDQAAVDDPLERYLDPIRLQSLDRFEQAQLSAVIRACRNSASLSEAGRYLFNRSRERRKTPNDADRLKKYLDRYGLNWQQLHDSFAQNQ